MKKFLLFLAVFACLSVSCNKFDWGDKPTDEEKSMVGVEMTWQLDSTLVIYNYQCPDETSEMLYPSDGMEVWSYTFYPYTYRFPKDLVFESELTGKPINVAKEYNEDYCKYICTYEGTIISAGYLGYYKDYFTFNGIQDGGWVEFMIREADAFWNVPVWISAFNAAEDLGGTVLERHVEYYSRVK